MNNLPEELKMKILKSQKAELTEHHIYKNLAKLIKNQKNSKILLHIAEEELSYYNFLKAMAEQECSPQKFKVFFYTFLSKILALNFGLKLKDLKFKNRFFEMIGISLGVAVMTAKAVYA